VDRKFKQIVIANKQLRKLLHRAGINRQDEGLDSETMEEHVSKHVTIYCRGTPVRSARDLFYKSDLCEVVIKAAEKNKASLHNLTLICYTHKCRRIRTSTLRHSS